MDDMRASTSTVEEELHRLRHQHRAMLDGLPDLVWLKDSEGRFLAVNAAFGRSCGMSPSELVGRTDYDVWPRELAEQYRRNDQLVMTGRKPLQVEEPLVEHDGRRRWIETIKTPYFDPSGRVVGTTGIARDIDARKQAEEALLASERNYRELVECANSIIIRIDASGRILFCNEFACRFFGYERDEIVGERLIDTIVPPLESTGRELWPMVSAICAAPDSYALNDNENITKDGRRVWVSWTNKPVSVGEGKEPEILCVGQDITEKTRLQALMFETEKMVTIGGLAAGMAHELNNPLGAIIQSVQNLRRRLSGGLAANEQAAADAGLSVAALQDYLERRGIFEILANVTSAGTRAADIISKMLAFSKKPMVGRSSAQVADIVDRAIELAACEYDLKKHYEFSAINIIRKFDPTVPPVVVNVAEIEQVMFNLLKNAAQALAERPAGRQPEITVTIAAQQGFVVIAVEDNGPGIPSSVRPHIFEPFFSTKQVGEGTGLGLSVSYAIVVQHHQGSIQVNSREGDGARFTVRLPCGRREGLINA